VTAQDVGDIYPRKVLFYPATGRARVRKIQDPNVEVIVSRELVYKKSMENLRVESEIELF
ncbi:MAG: hypothetical protein RLZZ226_2002, partial [Pseudomonadota bacterium]